MGFCKEGIVIQPAVKIFGPAHRQQASAEEQGLGEPQLAGVGQQFLDLLLLFGDLGGVLDHLLQCFAADLRCDGVGRGVRRG